MLRSMTGFGAAEGPVGPVRVAVEVRTVNHRFFNASLKLPSELARWEHDVRDALRAQVSRGHVTLSARVERPLAEVEDAARIDPEAFGRTVGTLRALHDQFGLEGSVDLATVLRVPGILAQPSDEIPEEAKGEFVALVASAATALMRMREDEGARLGAIVTSRLEIAEAALERIRVRAPERVAFHRERLSRGVADLLGNGAVDPQRLAQEIAILAERIDVGEELDRFRSHLSAFRATLGASGGEPVGKRLGFLLQEMLREANTTGSKASDAAMQHDVVALKEELERIREQVENLE